MVGPFAFFSFGGFASANDLETAAALAWCSVVSIVDEIIDQMLPCLVLNKY